MTGSGCLLTTQDDQVERRVSVSKRLQFQQQTDNDDDITLRRDHGARSQVSCNSKLFDRRINCEYVLSARQSAQIQRIQSHAAVHEISEYAFHTQFPGDIRC